MWYSQETNDDDDDEAVLAADYLFSHRRGFEMDCSTVSFVLLESSAAKRTAKVQIEPEVECVCR